VRFGILVREDGNTVPLDLFDEQTLEDYEWMWLHQAETSDWISGLGADSSTLVSSWGSVELDIRNRRRVGFTDSLLLYAGYADATGNTDIKLSTFAACVPQLRAVMLGR